MEISPSGIIRSPSGIVVSTNITVNNDPYEGSVDFIPISSDVAGLSTYPESPISGWRLITEDRPWRKKMMLLRNNNKALMRYEIR